MKIYQSNRAMLTQQRLGTIPSSVFVLTALGFLLHPISAQAAESGIEQITIYQGLASVTRTLPIAGSGEQTLVFSCLSPYLDQDSLSVQALGDVNVGEVSIETLSGEQAQLCQYQGDAKVKTQQNNLASIKADLDAARLAKAYLQNMTKVSQISVEGTLASNARELETQAAAINKRILEIEQQQARAQDALNQLMAGSSTTTQNSVTQVSVRTASRTPNTLLATDNYNAFARYNYHHGTVAESHPPKPESRTARTHTNSLPAPHLAYFESTAYWCLPAHR